MREDTGQLFVFAGDATSQGSNYETERFMECLVNKQAILALGNHDLFGNYIENVNQSFNEKVTVENVEFYILNVHCVVGIISHKVCPNLVDEAIEFLEEQMDTNYNESIAHRFIVMHTPIYSTGNFGSYPELTPKFEKFMDEHKDKKIRAVFGGHDHIFEAFKKDNVYYKLTGPGVHRFDPVHKLGSRSWHGNHLIGKLTNQENKHSMGYELHLNSSLNNTKTQVHIE